MKIEIKVEGNPGLYRSLRDDFASESSTHRTYTGAARRLVSLDRKSARWSETTGHWGRWRIIVDGLDLNKSYGEYDMWSDPSVDDAHRNYVDPVKYIADALRERHQDVISMLGGAPSK